MKLAVIAPKHFLPMTTITGLGFHMALGQELYRDIKYRDAYLKLHRRGHFIMVDNGAAEGDVLPFDQVVFAANTIRADEIVMPDVLRDGPKTVKAATNSEAQKLVSPNRRVIVPQGNSWEEWEQCLRSLVEAMPFATVGIAKHLERLEGGRKTALDIIKAYGWQGRFNVHMLGCYKQPINEAKVASTYKFVRSLDTGAPVAYAQAGVTLTDKSHYSLGWDSNADSNLVRKNIRILLGACNGS